MGRSIRLGKLFSIDVGVDYSWFIIFIFLTVSLALSYTSLFTDPWIAWVLGFITSILFFASILAHELSHSLVSLRYGIPVKSITLFIFGGVARITREVPRPGVELKMALAGPLCSLTLGLFFWLITAAILGDISALWPAWLFREESTSTASPLAVVTIWLAQINVLLAVFNMIPGFPLDGGRVFRSIVWSTTGDYGRATRIAYIGGRTVAYLFMVGGVVAVFMLPGLWFNGLWFIFIGWIIDMAAKSSYRQAKLRLALQPFTAEEIMTRDYPSVPRGLSLKQLIDNYLFFSGHRYFLVTEGSELQGLVTLADVEKVPREQQEWTTVGQVMTPAQKLTTTSPSDSAASVLEKMEEAEVQQLPVVWEGKVIGVITKEGLQRFLRIRSGYR